MHSRIVAALLLPGLAACASSSLQSGSSTTLRPAHDESRPSKSLKLEPIKLSAAAGSGSIEVLDALGLFESGGRYLAAGKNALAIEHYQRILDEFPASRLVSPALYNMGLGYEAIGRFDRAATQYAELVRRFGKNPDAIDAAFRLGACYAELGHWKRSAEVFGRLVTTKNLSASDRIEAYARQGLAHFRLHDHDAAGQTLRAGLRFFAHIDPIERLDDDFFVGMLHYYLAAIPHLRFREVKLRSDGAELAQQLDEKARLLLLAQARYIQTIQTKHPYWATAAGFQIGSLYQEFYTAMMRALPDFQAAAQSNARRANISVDEARRQLAQVYLETLHQRVKPLLQKAIRVFERNALVARRTGVTSVWVERSRRQIADLKCLLVATPEEAVRLLPRVDVLPEDQPVAPPDEVPPQAPLAGPQRVPGSPAPGARTGIGAARHL